MGPKSFFIIAGFTLGIILFGIVFGIVVNNTNSDQKNTLLPSLNGIITVTTILIILLGCLSLYFVKTDPSMFQPYVLVVLHISLFLSLLSTSFASLTKVA
jgi:uncharacterized membrane protein